MQPSTCPARGWNVPAAHGWHVENSSVVPGGQGVQEAFDAAPTTLPVEPGGQGVHASWPGCAANLPRAHAWHVALEVAEAAAEAVPRGQGKQRALAVPLKEPAGHDWHAATEIAAASGLCVPATQGSQRRPRR